MFKIGDYVVNAKNGICEIKDKVELTLTGSEMTYFLVVPIADRNGKIYVPVDKASDRMRLVMNEAEANAVIDDIPNIEELWIENEKQRENRYKEVIASCEPRALISIIKCLYKRNQQRDLAGKKKTVIDERYYRLAEDNLYSELAFSMGKAKEDMLSIIASRIEASC